jgi:hypothetical protein
MGLEKGANLFPPFGGGEFRLNRHIASRPPSVYCPLEEFLLSTNALPRWLGLYPAHAADDRSGLQHLEGTIVRRFHGRHCAGDYPRSYNANECGGIGPFSAHGSDGLRGVGGFTCLELCENVFRYRGRRYDSFVHHVSPKMRSTFVALLANLV